MWNNTDTCYYRLGDIVGKKGDVYAFDFDDTLVRRHSRIPLPNVIERLNEIIKGGNHIVVFSNQKGIEKKKTSHEEVQSIMNSFSERFSNSISFFYAISEDKYRKPMSGMYKLFRSLVDKKVVYYCGDAAGREKDFSISDLYFANNIGVKFKLPEEVFYYIKTDFLNETALKINRRAINRIYESDIWRGGILENKREIVPICSIPDELENHLNENDNEKKLLIMVGPQGSGKSTLSSIISNKYNFKIINNDSSGPLRLNVKRFVKMYDDKSTKGIIIDNTNPLKSTREEWVERAKGWKVIIVFIDISKDLSYHSVRYRQNNGHKGIPFVALHIYYKRLEKPTEDEGNIIKLEGVVHNDSKYDHNLRF